MKAYKLSALFLVLALLLAAFSACAGNAGNVIDDGGDRGADGSWDGVDFGGETLRMAVSANQEEEVTFPAANIYTMGPDKVTTDEVQKKVLARNQRLEEMLGLKVEYVTTDLSIYEVLGDIELRVRGAVEDAPDIYNNDLYGLARAMMVGYLWNVKNPGTDANGNTVKNYFDFSYEGWNYEYMKGCTFDQDKMYVLAGDYFIDMIRMAWVFYVNADIFNENGTALGYGDINAFYEYVETGIWDWDDLTYICRRVWKDTGAEINKNDECIGLVINHVSDRIFISSSGVTVFYQDEDLQPRFISDYGVFNEMANVLRTIMEGDGATNAKTDTGEGILFEQLVLSSTEYFFNGNVLFAASVLGELESTTMRDVTFAKGLVPFPKWDEQRQEAYHTMVHNQGELGAILKNATSFGKASAFMQAANEESRDVLYEYYEKGLKFKYSDDKGIRSMIDLVYNTIDKPFGMELGRIVCEEIGMSAIGLNQAAVSNVVASTYGSERIAYENALRQTLEKFEKLK